MRNMEWKCDQSEIIFHFVSVFYVTFYAYACHIHTTTVDRQQMTPHLTRKQNRNKIKLNKHVCLCIHSHTDNNSLNLPIVQFYFNYFCTLYFFFLIILPLFYLLDFIFNFQKIMAVINTKSQIHTRTHARTRFMCCVWIDNKIKSTCIIFGDGIVSILVFWMHFSISNSYANWNENKFQLQILSCFFFVFVFHLVGQQQQSLQIWGKKIFHQIWQPFQATTTTTTKKNPIDCIRQILWNLKN